jgi:pyruvate/2-oxoglutarate dehydrogenase complex dihydrolipoamide acyltransferase (E2) component
MAVGGNWTMEESTPHYTVEPFPVGRRFSLDAGVRARKTHAIHGLLEMDVTRARQVIQANKARTGEGLSFTAYIIACLAKAIESDRHVHAYLDWRNRLVIFDDVDVNTMVEVDSQGGKIVMPLIIRAANRKTPLDMHAEIRAAKAQPSSTGEMSFMRYFLYLPGFMRRWFYWLVTRNPVRFRRLSSSVLVTAVGMFGKGGGWGIPAISFPLTVTLGGIAEKPGVVEGRIEIRQYLCVTVSFNHDIIDGAPAARFTQKFRELVETAYGLDALYS